MNKWSGFGMWIEGTGDVEVPGFDVSRPVGGLRTVGGPTSEPLGPL